MRLLDNLYYIETLDNNENAENFSYTIRLNPDCFIYQAHFPGNPITPGVCILQILTELAEEKLERSLDLSVLNNVKYISIISPIENPKIEYNFTNTVINGDEVKIKAMVKNPNAIFAKISVTYKML